MLDETVIDSLKNRRVLLEKEITEYKNICARLYLKQIGLPKKYASDGHLIVDEYEAYVEYLTSRISELKQVNIFLGEL